MNNPWVELALSGKTGTAVDQQMANESYGYGALELSNPEGINQYTKGAGSAVSEARTAHQESLHGHGPNMREGIQASNKALTASKAAQKATSEAVKSGSDHLVAHEAHMDAHDAHLAAAAKHEKLGNPDAAVAHLNAADSHKAMANKHENAVDPGKELSLSTSDDDDKVDTSGDPVKYDCPNCGEKHEKTDKGTCAGCGKPWPSGKLGLNLGDHLFTDADLMLGGAGSGNFGHAGRPGERGGSMSASGSSEAAEKASKVAAKATAKAESTGKATHHEAAKSAHEAAQTAHTKAATHFKALAQAVKAAGHAGKAAEHNEMAKHHAAMAKGEKTSAKGGDSKAAASPPPKEGGKSDARKLSDKAVNLSKKAGVDMDKLTGGAPLTARDHRKFASAHYEEHAETGYGDHKKAGDAHMAAAAAMKAEAAKR